MKRRIESPRFTRVDYIPPSDYIYQFKVRRTDDLDEEVADWMAEAARVGRQAST